MQASAIWKTDCSSSSSSSSSHRNLFSCVRGCSLSVRSQCLPARPLELWEAMPFCSFSLAETLLSRAARHARSLHRLLRGLLHMADGCIRQPALEGIRRSHVSAAFLPLPAIAPVTVHRQHMGSGVEHTASASLLCASRFLSHRGSSVLRSAVHPRGAGGESLPDQRNVRMQLSVTDWNRSMYAAVFR